MAGEMDSYTIAGFPHVVCGGQVHAMGHSESEQMPIDFMSPHLFQRGVAFLHDPHSRSRILY